MSLDAEFHRSFSESTEPSIAQQRQSMNAELHDQDSIRVSVFNISVVAVLMSAWFTVYTLGSQIPQEKQTSTVMKYLTSQNPNIIILGCLSSMLGVFRRRINENSTDQGLPDYISSVISGFITSMVALTFPSIISNGGANFKPDQSTYNAFSLAISIFAFYSGHDRNFLDRITQKLFK